MFFLNCFNAEEEATATKRYTLINAAESIQDRYFENTWITKFKSNVCYFEDDDLLLFAQKMRSCGFILS